MRRKLYKDKTFMIVLLICLIAATAIAIGSVAINRNNDNSNKENLVDLNEDNEEDSTQPVNSQVESTTEEETQNTEETYVQETDVKDVASNNISSLSFTSESKLYWPIEGDVILDYNMDNTIYFPTLNKYQCNPAIIIQGDVDTPVLSSAEGVVKEISEDEELGQSVVVSLGNNYEVTYGQLKNVQVTVGQAVKAKDVIAYINTPTKYYTVEGNNLYFKLTKDSEPIDPLDYLTY